MEYIFRFFYLQLQIYNHYFRLSVLEKLPYKSIILTTINPKNRYIRFNGVKPNNNIRDFYYTSIMLGGQKETLYNETKIIRLKEPLA